MAIDYKCVCGAVLSFADDQAGFEVECPQCSRRFPLPSDPANPAAPPAQRPKRSMMAGGAVGIVVAIVVLVGALLALLTQRDLPAAAPEMRFIPEDAAVVGGVNVWRIVRIGTVQETLEPLLEHEGYALLAQAGLEWDQVDTLHFALGGDIAETDEPKALVLLRNRRPIHLDRLAEAAGGAEGGQATERAVGDRMGYVFRMQGEETVAVLLEDTLLAAGDESMLAKAVALAEGEGESVVSNVRLMELARSGARPELAWLVADLPEERMRAMGQDLSLGPVRPESFQGLLAHVDYSEERGLVVGASLLCESEEAAEQALPAIQTAVLTLAPMMLQIDQEAFDFVRDGPLVNMTATLPDEMLRQLADQAGQRIASELDAAERRDQMPEWVLDQEHTLIMAEEPFEERSFAYRDIKDEFIDPTTGYRIIDGKAWALPMVCATSKIEDDPHRIPLPPHVLGEDLDALLAEPYPCPICGEEANPEALGAPDEEEEEEEDKEAEADGQ